ncbi:MAG: hypothetical protein ABI700_14740 [Chloroflexota bacterium]
MVNLDRSEEVYQCIWNYVTECSALPTDAQIAEALRIPNDDVGNYVRTLRAANRIEPTLLLPTEYSAWWRVYGRSRWSRPLLKLLPTLSA